MSKPFYKTTPLTDFELAEAISKATKQEDAIMLYFQHKSPQELNAYQLHNHFNKWPITSIRRALFNLEAKGMIVHVGWVKGEMDMAVGSFRVALPSDKIGKDENDLIPEGLAAKMIGRQILKMWLAENKIPYTGKKPKKFRQKDLNKAIMSEFAKNVDHKVKGE